MAYINIKDSSGKVETIDEGTYKECRQWIKDYRLVYRGTGYDVYISQRSTKEWKER
jgi:hypothetical protein